MANVDFKTRPFGQLFNPNLREKEKFVKNKYECNIITGSCIGTQCGMR